MLACADQAPPNTAVAKRLGVSRQSIASWRQRFVTHWVEGLSDAPRSGTHQVYSWNAVPVVAGTADVLLTATVDGLVPDMLYRWRARVLRADLTGALPAAPERGPWRRLGAQSAEADIRVAVPEPTVAAGLLAGAALIGVLHRRRTRRQAAALSAPPTVS